MFSITNFILVCFLLGTKVCALGCHLIMSEANKQKLYNFDTFLDQPGAKKGLRFPKVPHANMAINLDTHNSSVCGYFVDLRTDTKQVCVLTTCSKCGNCSRFVSMQFKEIEEN